MRLRLAPWFLVSALLATPLPAAEDPVLQTLVQVKAAYRAKRWADADLALRRLLTPGDIEGDVETWYYRKGRVPKGIPFQELRFTFFTKEGYGVGVFQKDARELLALQKATRLLRLGS